MASTHKSLRSGTANKRPTTSIADGQIALNTNTTSPGLFFKDSTGATIIKVGPVHVGTTAPNASPAAGGSAGNSVGEIWLDTSLTPVGVKIWNGSAFVNATPIGSTTVQGLLELATNAETQTGTDPDRAVTPAGLQSKVSDSTSTTSSTTIASSTAVKSAYDLANAALPKSGGTVTGNLEIGTTGSLSFEGATADAFETTIAVVDPTADRTITLPDTTGTVVTTGDTGTVTSTMIADGTIVDGDISASAEIAVSKLADGAARQLLQTDAAGTGVEWASNIDVPGTLDVTSTATFDSIASHPLGSAAAPTLTFTGDTNTGIYSPGADQVAISTNGTGRLFVDASGRVGVGTTPSTVLHCSSTDAVLTLQGTRGTGATASIGTGGTNSQNLVITAGTDLYQRGATHLFQNVAGTTEYARITSAGLVGVGTSSPATTLDVNGTITCGTPGGVALSIAGGSAIRNLSAAASRMYFDTSFGSATHGSFEFRSSNAGTSRLVIDTSGNVGIGTSSPGYNLELVGTNPTLGIRTNLQSASSASTILFRNKDGNGNDYDIGKVVSATTGNGGYGELQFYTAFNNTLSQRAVLTREGRLGIGNNSPQAVFHSKAGATTSAGIFESNSGSGSWLSFVDTGTSSYTRVQVGSVGNELVLRTTDAERARIDSSGRLLVGTSDGSGSVGRIIVQGASNGSATGVLQIAYNGSATAPLSAGTQLGFLRFTDQGSNGNVFAQIQAEVDATTGAGDYPGRLVFSVTSDGASSPTERMRINNSGNVGIGLAYTGAAVRLVTKGNGTSSSGYAFEAMDSGENTLLYCRNDGYINTGTRAVSPYNNTTASAANVNLFSDGGLYRSTSSIRYKTDVETIENQYSDALLECRPVWYKSLCAGDNKEWGYWGFIAEEVAQIDPRLCFFKENEDGTLEPEGVQYDRFVPHLLNLIKRQQQAIETLEAKVAALESA